MEVNIGMVKIRLRRMGAKKAPFYRIVVADSRSPRDGRFIEEIGTYDPAADSEKIKVDMERAKYWIANGAQPTDTVRGLLKQIDCCCLQAPMRIYTPLSDYSWKARRSDSIRL